MSHGVASPLAVILLTALPFAAAAQQQDMSKEAKIKNALASAPPEVADNATVQDWDQTVLKQGSNGFTCLPDFPDTPGNDPMCLDDVWLAWAHAYMNKEEPQIEGVGIGYMLTSDAAGSNTDPYATEPTADNQWIEGGPHLMVLVPDPKALKTLPTDPTLGVPWVMWKDTPYVHVMIPMGKKPGGHEH